MQLLKNNSTFLVFLASC